MTRARPALGHDEPPSEAMAHDEGGTVDLLIVGAGAAGLMAGIQAARRHPHRRVVILDSARKPGAKILVAGGGRCNVTHDRVDETAFAGSTRPAIRKVLRRFDVDRTIEFFARLGVNLKREQTGKLFPTTDSARTVLAALLRAASDAGVVLRHPRRVETIRRVAPPEGHGFLIEGPPPGPGAWGSIVARRVVLATGGRSLPKSGSDGHGYAIARSLGHTITDLVLPGLVPLTLPPGSFLRALSGLSTPVTLEVRTNGRGGGASFTGPALCTHFGISGPAVLDVSRYFLHAKHADPRAHLIVNWLPGETAASVDSTLVRLGRSGPMRALRGRLPERLARALCLEAGVDPTAPASRVPRERRRALSAALAEMTLPVTGDRGFDAAEVTAGGVPLSELHLDSMRSRVCDGLILCGEICDVDGRVGGFNFQWAWASGYVAGVGDD